MGEAPIQKVVRDLLYEQVVRQMEALIEAGKLRPGDRLPPERELALRLGVTRGVVREATKALVARGLVASRPAEALSLLPSTGPPFLATLCATCAWATTT